MSITTTDRETGLATRRAWLGLAALCLPVLIVSMDVSVLFFAAPDIAATLRPSATQQLWIFDVYGFVLAGLLLTMGALGDRFGRRRLLVIGAVAFSAASAIAAWSTSPEALIAARALMGVGGATLMPSTLALIRNLFDDESQRSRAVGIWSAVLAMGVGIGPVVAGVLLAHFWWGSVFLINLPVMLALVVVAPLVLPESRAGRARVDLLSAALVLGSVLPLIHGLQGLAADGWSAQHVAYAVCGLVVGVAFVVRQAAMAHPMLDLALLRRRGVGSSVAVNVIAQLAIMGNAILLTQYLQSVLGMSALRAALWSLAPTIVVGAVAPMAGVLAGRIGRPVVMASGLLVAAGGFAELLVTSAHSSIWTALLGATLVAAGLVAVLTLVTEFVIGSVPADRAGTMSGMLETTSEFAGALGMAVLGSIVNAVYRTEMAGAPGASGPAGETLAGAVVESGRSGGAAGAALLEGARTAYVIAMHRADVVAAALLVVGAVIALTRLPRTPVA